jgi:hypothetical protein
VPLEHALEDTLAIRLDHIAVTRNDPLKVPLLNPSDRLCEALAVSLGGSIPVEASLPGRSAPRVHDPDKELGQESSISRYSRLRELLCSGEVEDEVGFDERLAGLVEHHDLLVGVAGHVLDVELGIKFLGDLGISLFGGVDGAERRALGLGVRLSLFGQPFHADDLGLGVGFGPGGEEDVVFDVQGDDVFEGAERGDGLLDFFGEGSGGEDGEGAGLEADCRQMSVSMLL